MSQGYRLGSCLMTLFEAACPCRAGDFNGVLQAPGGLTNARITRDRSLHIANSGAVTRPSGGQQRHTQNGSGKMSEEGCNMLRLRGLPYSVALDDIYNFFEGYEVAAAHLIVRGGELDFKHPFRSDPVGDRHPSVPNPTQESLLGRHTSSSRTTKRPQERSS